MRPLKLFILILLLLLVACDSDVANESSNAAISPTENAVVAENTAVPTPTEEAEPTAKPIDIANFTRRAMLEDIGYGVILPLHERFVQETAVLRDAIYAFEASPSEETLVVMQDAWKVAAATWKQAEFLDFDGLIFGRVYHWPAETEFVERLIAEPSYVLDEEFIITRGSFAQGLPIIEYFIFDDKQSDAAIVARFTDAELGERRLQYLVATGELLHGTATKLLAFWSPQEKDYLSVFVAADEAANEPQGSINALANKMIEQLEGIGKVKLAQPAGFLDPEAEVGIVEAPFSHQSADHIVQNLRGFEQLFTGGDGFGFDDYLDFLEAGYGDEPLSVAIKTQIEAAIVAIERIEQPLETAVVENPEAVLLAYEELNRLVRLTKTDMANHMGLVITFEDADSD